MSKTNKDAPFKPLTCNRNELDPFAVIIAGHGTAADRDRATVQLREEHVKLHAAVESGFAQIGHAIEQLDRREREHRAHRALPWYRRWFRRPPALQPLTLPEPEPPADAEDETPEE